MNLDIMNIRELNNVNIDMQYFYRIMEVIKLALIKIGISIDGIFVFYQRKDDATSVLAIKVVDGDDNDLKNYMLNGCQTWYEGNSVSCDVYLHSNAKSAQMAIKLSNLISKDIVNFFEQIEEYLLKNNKKDLSLDLKLSLGEEKKKDNFKNIMKRILRR